MRLINTRTAAAMLGKSPATLRGWRCMKKGPKVVELAGSTVMYKEEDIITYVAEGERTFPARAALERPYASHS